MGGRHAILKASETSEALTSVCPLLKCQGLFTGSVSHLRWGRFRSVVLSEGGVISHKEYFDKYENFFFLVSLIMVGYATSFLVDRCHKKILTLNTAPLSFSSNLGTGCILYINTKHFHMDLNIC